MEDVLSFILKILSQQINICPKSTIETLEKGVNDVNDVVLLYLLLTLNNFHTFSYLCFNRRLRTIDKQILKNCQPMSLLPICGKFSERLLHNRMFKFVIENELNSSNQSGFKPGDLCINQHISINHEI